MTTGEFLKHTVIQGERWDTLAWEYYADASRYEEILRANPGLRDVLGQWPVVPTEGTILLIPVLNQVGTPLPVEALPPWIR